MSSESNFAYSIKHNTHFIVKNITAYTDAQILSEFNLTYAREIRSPKKTIKIFNYPINIGGTRDLLGIPGIQESDLRASLLKGALRNKFACGDIALISSNINLLQFSTKQLYWLRSLGFKTGIDINVNQLNEKTINFIHSVGSGVQYLWRENIPLIGIKNNINRTFYTPEKFINGSYYNNIFYIAIDHNGKKLYENIDFTISESNGPGSGYDMINIISFIPNVNSLLYSTFAIKV
jgi:hypothetical protein